MDRGLVNDRLYQLYGIPTHYHESMMNYLFATIFSLLFFISNATYAQSVRISNLQDISLGTISTMDGETRTTEISVCAYEISDTDNKYWIEVNDGFSNGELELTDSLTGNKIVMGVRWRQANGRYKKLAEDAASRLNGTTDSTDCTTGDNAGIEIEVTQRDTEGVPAGTYTATLNITMHAKAP